MFPTTKKLYKFILSIAFVFLSFFAVAQQDSIVQKKEPTKLTQYHSPRTATILSAFLPGAGQVYNKKYWKLPIVYSVLGAIGYLAYKQQDSINNINADLALRFDSNPTTFGKYHNLWSDQQMLVAYDATLKKRDLFFILGIALYALQIVDANVDAHLFYFDVSNDLSLKFTPECNRLAYADYTTGIKLTLNIK